MNRLKLPDNIIRLRHSKNITQEQLADFIGVTKASVSKWETGASYPDIMTLPVLAAFFDISIDELMGYEPNLSKEQIQKLYRELAADFAKMPFDDAMEKSMVLAKKYYSCYPFLYQICLLWLNHFMLPQDTAKQSEVLNNMSKLCCHIISNCKDIRISNDTIILKAMTDLQLGNAGEVIDTLEEILNPYSLANHCDNILIQAYELSENKEKTLSFAQISMYSHLISLITSATQYIATKSNSADACEETISRIQSLIEIYDLEHLHPNHAAVFDYMAAIFYCTQQNADKALTMLKKYSLYISRLFKNGTPTLYGDSYFNMIDSWLEQSDMGSNTPRSSKVTINEAISALNIPQFEILKDRNEFIRIKESIEKIGGKL